MMKTTTPPLIQLGARLAMGERPWMAPLKIAGGITMGYLLLRYSWAAVGPAQDDMPGLFRAVAVLTSGGAVVGALAGWTAALALAMRCRRARRAWGQLTPREQRYALQMQDEEFAAVMQRLDAAQAGEDVDSPRH